MPSTRAPSISASDLPEVMTPQVLADYERLDVRVIRTALARGEIAGAWRRGTRWRIQRDTYLAALSGGRRDA